MIFGASSFSSIWRYWRSLEVESELTERAPGGKKGAVLRRLGLKRRAAVDGWEGGGGCSTLGGFSGDEGIADGLFNVSSGS